MPSHLSLLSVRLTRGCVIFSFALLASSWTAVAQAPNAPTPPPEPDTGVGPVSPAAHRAASPDKTVVLDPFEVQATADNSYGELNSSSLTAFKTELDQMPVSADVFDQTFLKDTVLTTVEETIQFFSAGSGSFGQSPDTSASNSQFLDRNANGSLSLRGLSSPTLLINGFFPASNNGAGTNTGTSRDNSTMGWAPIGWRCEWRSSTRLMAATASSSAVPCKANMSKLPFAH